MAEQVDVRPHRNHGKDAERTECCDGRSDEVQELIGSAGPHVFLEQKLACIRDCLEQTERASHVRARTGLHATEATTLNPEGKKNVQDQVNDDEDGLDERQPPCFLREICCGVIRHRTEQGIHRATSPVALRATRQPASPSD